MGIRTEFKRAGYYGAEWRRFRLALIAKLGPICSRCKKITPKYLNLVHLKHDPATSEVALMCPACHNRYDRLHRNAIRRRIKARKDRQRWIGNTEDAPAWKVKKEPGRAKKRIASAQEALF